MSFSLINKRPGTTLIELLLFLGIFSICAGVVVLLLIFTGEQRIRQQTAINTELEGSQIVQMLSRRIRSAERILLPSRGSTGSILALQVSQREINPTIIVLQTDTIVVAENNTVRVISSEDFNVSDLVFQNTSPTNGRPSVLMSFTATRRIPIPEQTNYVQIFDSLITLFPDDELTGDECGCNPPQCIDEILSWQVCEADTCVDATSTLPCQMSE